MWLNWALPSTPLQCRVCGGWGEDGGREKQSLILGNQKKRGWNFFKLATLNNPKQVFQRPNSPDNHVPSCLSARKVSSWRHLNQEKEARGRRAQLPQVPEELKWVSLMQVLGRLSHHPGAGPGPSLCPALRTHGSAQACKDKYSSFSL